MLVAQARGGAREVGRGVAKRQLDGHEKGRAVGSQLIGGSRDEGQVGETEGWLAGFYPEGSEAFSKKNSKARKFS